MSIHDLIQNAEPAPAGVKGGTMAEQLRQLAPVIIDGLLERKPPSLGALADLLGHDTANWVGTLLGNARGGAHLWKAASGIMVCQSNVALMLKHVTDVSAFLVERGLTEEQFLEKVAALPK